MKLKRILLAAYCSALAACANFSNIVPHARRVDPQSMDVGSALQAQADAAWPDDFWWQAYRDPQLDSLVRDVLDGNPDLRAASARVTQAQGLAAMRYGATLPQLEANAAITRTYLSKEQISAALSGAHTYWDGSILLNASYDLDLWGARRSALAGALDAVKAGEAEERAAQLALATVAVQGYVQLSEQYALRDIAQANLEREQRILHIAQRRYSAGLGTRLEVEEASTVLSDTLAQIDAIEEAIALQVHQLAALGYNVRSVAEQLSR